MLDAREDSEMLSYEMNKEIIDEHFQTYGDGAGVGSPVGSSVGSGVGALKKENANVSEFGEKSRRSNQVVIV